MEYSIRILRVNMPTFNVKVEAHNVFDALENKININSDYLLIAPNSINGIVVDMDEATIPIDEIGLKQLTDGMWRISLDNSELYVQFKENDFIASALVASENGCSVEQNSVEAKELLRKAADWIYYCGFSNIALNNAKRLHF